MAKIIIIGAGNVGSHLAKAFSIAGEEVTLLSARRLSAEERTLDAEIAIIAVPDAYITECAAKLSDFTGIVAHTSGGAGIDALQAISPSRRAVFYPLQTFTKDVEMEYSEIPFFIETADDTAAETLKTLALKISPHVIYADSTTRCRLHIAAVFACNFTNHLWAVAYEYLKSCGLDFSLLMPLIRQTLTKIQDNASTSDPALMQTGPAVRNDLPTIERHLSLLDDRPEMASLYHKITESIISHHNH